jgi:2-amino-4-hydroxy-6-hydroxymethyldihydropteridine diphosphokinase
VKRETRNSKPETPRLAVIALGSNLGDSAATVRAAMAALEPLAASPLLRSSLLRTAPVDCPPGSPDFVNAVVAFEPIAGETPESLLEKLHAVEQRFGRQRSGLVNEARSLDLDLIAFGNERRSTPPLTLPHPRATLRQFVLTPLAEILPEFQVPGWPATAGELARLTDQGVRK